MIVKIIGDNYEGYYITDDLSWGIGYEIDVTEKFWERFKAYAAEQEFIQSKLHRYYEDCKKQELINKTKDGKQPIGF